MGCKSRIVALSLVLLFCGGSADKLSPSTAFDMRSRNVYQELILSNIQSGDIILRKGRSVFSDLIAHGLGSMGDVSHCGIIVCEKDTSFVIHTISGQIDSMDGIRKTALNDFIDGAEQGIIHVVRYKNLQSPQAVSLAAQELYRQKIPFDHAFDANDNSKLYCSELIRDVFLATEGSDVFDYKTKYNLRFPDFNSFFDNNRFIQIYSNLSKSTY